MRLLKSVLLIILASGMPSSVRLAEITGTALNPFAVWTALFVAAAVAFSGPEKGLVYVGIEVAAASVAFGYLWLWTRLRKVSGFWLPLRQERSVPAAVLIGIGAAMVYFLFVAGAPADLLKVAGSMVVLAVLMGLVTLIGKGSVH